MNVIHENILVEVPDDSKPGGIFIPEEEKVEVFVGTVIRYGEAVPKLVQKQLDTSVKIEYKKFYDGAELTIGKKKYIVMSYKDILIIL